MKSFLKKFFDEKFFKFILVGIINTLVGMAIMFGLYHLAGLKRLDGGQWGDLGYWISSASNYILTSILSYFLNKHFTFKNREKGLKPALRFIINIAVCYVIAYALAKPLAISILSGTSLPADIQNTVAMLVGMCLFVALNYIGQRFFSFKTKEDKDIEA